MSGFVESIALSSRAFLAFLGVAIVIVGALMLFLRMRRKPAGRRADPYVDALSALVDGDRDGAFKHLERAVRAGGARPDAYIRLGDLLRERGDAGRALQVHRSLTVKDDLAPREKRALFLSMAEDYAALGNSGQALRVLGTLRGRSGARDPAVLRVMAREAHRQGDAEAAFGFIRALYGRDASRRLALYLASAGETKMEGDDKREATRWFQRALKHDSSCVPARMGMGRLSESDDEIGDAIGHWTVAAKTSRAVAGEALRAIERAAYRAGRFGEMEKVYRDVLAARPDDEDATVSLAAFFRKQGRLDDAVGMLRSYLDEHAGSLRVAMMLASCYASQGQTREAEELADATREQVRSSGRWTCGVCGRSSTTARWHCMECNSFDSYALVSS